MRQFKIRAYDEINNKMWTPMEWESGVGVSIPNAYFDLTQTEHILGCRWNGVIFMQYSDEQDIYKEQICEGDILKRVRTNPFWNNDKVDYGVVTHEKSSLRVFGDVVQESILDGDYKRYYEIVGNKYEDKQKLDLI